MYKPIINSLIDEYHEWLRVNNLPAFSADEWDLSTLTDEQAEFVRNFISRWEAAEDV